MLTRNKYLNKVIIFIFTAGLMLSTNVLLAQDEACQGQDPTNSSTTCPLDNWVLVLVIIAAIFGAVTLNVRQNKQVTSKA